MTPVRVKTMAGLYPSTSLGRNKEPNPRDPAQGESVGMPLEPGRRVRLLIRKDSNGTLRRGCSDEVFIVSGVSRNNPNAYYLKDERGGEIYGRFYRQQLKALADQPDFFSFFGMGRGLVSAHAEAPMSVPTRVIGPMASLRGERNRPQSSAHLNPTQLGMYMDSAYFAVVFPVEVAQTESFIGNVERLAETNGTDFAIIRTSSDRWEHENNGPVDDNARQPQHPIAMLLMLTPIGGKFITPNNSMATRAMDGARGTCVPVSAHGIPSFRRRKFLGGVASDDYIAHKGDTFAVEAINSAWWPRAGIVGYMFAPKSLPGPDEADVRDNRRMAREQRDIEMESLEALQKRMPKDLSDARAFYLWPGQNFDPLLLTHDQLHMVYEFVRLCEMKPTLLDSRMPLMWHCDVYAKDLTGRDLLHILLPPAEPAIARAA